MRRRSLIEIKSGGFFLVRREEVEEFGRMGRREGKGWKRRRWLRV